VLTSVLTYAIAAIARDCKQAVRAADYAVSRCSSASRRWPSVDSPCNAILPVDRRLARDWRELHLNRHALPLGIGEERKQPLPWVDQGADEANVFAKRMRGPEAPHRTRQSAH
jgi:hypothetical protein